ncbi:MAG: hypothetical protein Q4G16_06410 [Cruoricaptor ignavus]|nr:hypothetical protein [Cruoricaptor ignavus]
MYKKIFRFTALLLGFACFSQTILNGYESPHTVQDNNNIRMLPDFHTNSNDGNYGQAVFIARIGNPSGTTQPPVVYSPSFTENYISYRTYLYPTATSNNHIPQLQSIEYFDGLSVWRILLFRFYN